MRTIPRGKAKSPYDRAMTKRITDSQILGELGETAIKKLVLEMQFIFDRVVGSKPGRTGSSSCAILRAVRHSVTAWRSGQGDRK